jgi:hypothetical protein
MMLRNPYPANAGTVGSRMGFEEFTASSDWRALPLDIKLTLVKFWRAEHDVPPKTADE